MFRDLIRYPLMLLMLLPGLGRAEEYAEQDLFSLSGFATLGAVYNSTDQADFLRDLSQREGAGYTRQLDFGVDSLIGLQLDAKINSEISASAQLLSHRRYDNSYTPELNWGFVKYTPNDSVQARAGRLGFDVYMQADSRNVGYSYLPVRPPVDYYGGLPISYLDGVDFVLKHPIGEGIARLELAMGYAREKLPVQGSDNSLDLNGSPLWGGYLDYQLQNWQFRVGYARLTLENELPDLDLLLNVLRSPQLQSFPGPAQFADDAMIKGKTVEFISAGMVYDNGPLQIQLMLRRLLATTISYPDNDAGYLMLAYRVGPFTPYASYSIVKPKIIKHDLGLPDIPAFAQVNGLSRLIQPYPLSDQSTYSLGVRYDVMRNLDLKFQVDQVDGRDSFQWANKQPAWDGRATIYSLTLDFIF
ncbi:hypothetical protein HA050_05660 [Iodobacter sp. HSC-16F04]|uniref:Porin n=1 Tax=Iodobacter violaceini TaxID=3044271 RepID=A0ABX0KU75_9NEIS|nr:hypothetical protein [Iodobacter violacea]NHQ85604.1 hypothetical protein [Iodobacter violacea]